MWFGAGKANIAGLLLSKLFLFIIAFPPLYLVARYLKWCCKETTPDQEADET